MGSQEARVRTCARLAVELALSLGALWSSLGWSTLAVAATESSAVTIRFAPGVVSSAKDRNGELGYEANNFSFHFNEATFASKDLASTLAALGAEAFTTYAPGFRHLPKQSANHLGESVALVDFTDVYTVTFANDDMDSLIEKLSMMSDVVYATPQVPSKIGYTPNDPYYANQGWHLNNTGQVFFGTQCVPDVDANVSQAWDIQRGYGTKIGILDTGIFDIPQDLATALDTGLSAAFAPYQDPCGLGSSHGTPVSGVALAIGNNGIGVASPANTPEVIGDHPLVMCRVSTSCSEIDIGAASSALSYLGSSAYPQVMVVNSSWYGGRCFHSGNAVYRYDPAQRDAFRNAFLLDLALFACGGNGPAVCTSGISTPTCLGSRCWQFPAAFDDYCFGVRGVTCTGQDPAGGQTPGFWIDATAPTEVYTTDAGGAAYRVFGGCSAATPVAASVAAMLLKCEPAATNEDVYGILKTTARSIGNEDVYGAGLIRADAALSVVSSPNKLFHGYTTGPFTANLVEQRNQWFENVDGLTGITNTWHKFYAHVYKATATVAFPGNAPVYDPVLGVWCRGRGTTGAADNDSLDVLFWSGYANVVPGSVTPSQCTLETFTYKIYEVDQTTFRCWYPFAATGVGPVCGSAGGFPTLQYSYLANTSTTVAGGARGAIDQQVSRVVRPGESVAVEYEVPRLARVVGRVFDVSGRLVTEVHPARFEAAGKHVLRWDGRRQDGARCARGAYFMTVEVGHDRESWTLFVTR